MQHSKETYQLIETSDLITKTVDILNEQGLPYRAHRASFGPEDKRKDHIIIDLPSLTNTVLGDEVIPQIRVLNSYDKSAACRIMLGAFRMVCFNGLAFGDFLYSQRIVHRTGPTADSKLDSFPEMLHNSLIVLQSDWKDEVEELASKQLDVEQQIQVIGSLPVSDGVKHRAINRTFFPRRKADQHHQGNLWGLWNNVNESLREKSRGESAVKANDKLLEDIIILAEAA